METLKSQPVLSSPIASAPEVAAPQRPSNRGILASPDLLSLLFIGLFWVALIVVTKPWGDFPLNDDWTYGYSVFGLVKNGQLRLIAWEQASLIAQVIWGFFWVHLFGATWESLKVSCIALGLAALVLVYMIMRELGVRPLWSTLAALTVASNPIFFCSSCSFMTEIPFLTATYASFYFCLRGLSSTLRPRILLPLILTSITAILIRQHGLILPVAFGMVWCVKQRHAPRTWFHGCLPALAAVLALVAYEAWLALHGLLPANHPNARLGSVVHEILSYLSAPNTALRPRCVALLLYSAVMLSPIVVPMAFSRKLTSIKSAWLCAALALLIAFRSIGMQRLMPLYHNIISEYGVGPLTLRASIVPGIPPMPWLLRFLATLIAWFAVLLIIQMFTPTRLKQLNLSLKRPNYILVLSILSFGMYATAICLQGDEIDRYFLPVLLPGLACAPYAIREMGPSSARVASLLIFCFAVFSVMGVHDYYAWNRARWSALNYMNNTCKISANKIDGGIEYNGLYNYSPVQIKSNKTRWWVADDCYAVTYGSCKGFSQVASFPYQHWMPPVQQACILILRRNDVKAGDNEHQI